MLLNMMVYVLRYLSVPSFVSCLLILIVRYFLPLITLIKWETKAHMYAISTESVPLHHLTLDRYGSTQMVRKHILHLMRRNIRLCAPWPMRQAWPI